MIDSALEAAVAALPEFYQPIFGHADRWPASRATEDRFQAILPVVEAFRALHGRPPRILDIGCAQGYLCFRLAESGASVLGIDNDIRNIRVCTALAGHHPHLAARFEEADAIDYLEGLPEDGFDLVIGLSVFHHVCYRIGVAATRKLLSGLARKVPIALFELAVRQEPLYWAAALPADPYALVEDYLFIREIGQFTTHLSAVPRPLLFCSNEDALLGKTLYRIDSIRSQSVAGIHDGEAAGQAYIESGAEFLKLVTMRSLNWSARRAELAREAAFLSGPDRADEDPVVFEYVDTPNEAWLRRSRIPGETLDIVKSRGERVDPVRITRCVLRELARLEALGWFHADLSLWNVVLTPDGDARLIDFGALTREPRNCVWPEDLRFAFGQFLFDLTSDLPIRAFPIRRPRFRPAHLPFPFGDAMALMLAEMPAWSAQAMLERIDRVIRQGPSSTPAGLEAALATALDAHVDSLGDTVEAVRSGFVQQRDGLQAMFQWRSAMEGAHHQTRVMAGSLDARMGGLENAHHETRLIITALEARFAGIEQAHHETRLMLVEIASRQAEGFFARLRRQIGW